MGKQVRFYMMPEDELRFLQYVCQDRDVVLLAASSPKPGLQAIDNSLVSLQQRSELITILLWRKEFPIKESDVQELYLREYKEDLGAYVETGEIIYSINKSSAPVIEFSPSFIRNDELLMKGRIWADMYRLEGDNLVHKGENFESWYDRVVQWIHRNSKCVEGIDGYFGPQAFEWYKEGGQLAKD